MFLFSPHLRAFFYLDIVLYQSSILYVPSNMFEYNELFEGLSEADQVNAEVIGNRLAARSLEPYQYQIQQALDDFDYEYPEIASAIKEYQYLSKKQKEERKVSGAKVMAVVGVVGAILSPLAIVPLGVIAGSSLVGAAIQLSKSEE